MYVCVGVGVWLNPASLGAVTSRVCCLLFQYILIALDDFHFTFLLCFLNHLIHLLDAGFLLSWRPQVMLGSVASGIDHFVVTIVVVIVVVTAIVKGPAMLETTPCMSTTASTRLIARRMETSRTDATRSCASISCTR